MRNELTFLLLILTSGLIAERFAIRETETIRRTLEFSGSGARTLDVDNVNGQIHVTGYDGAAVEMSANRTIRAESQDRTEAAKREVKLDIADKSDLIRIYVDGPFRHGGRDGSGYEVTFDFDLRVPRSVKLRLRSVNGPIQTGEAFGDFDVNTVNGGITMTDIAGSGSVQAVNGGVTAEFIGKLKSASSF